ncbi:MAG: tetratricopeptide repeat protein [Burkholderiaceae bacterium]|nr:MAG: tetratricopeptide repeat protein [Burkholderiaceae bacterium]
MTVTIELAFPENEDLFEEMCFHLYRKDWNDPGCVRLGGQGQGQFGLDILGTQNGKQMGIQCKHYVKKPFTLSTVKNDVEKADTAGIAVDHVIFATTAPSKSELVLKVRELSETRRKLGKFTVSVAFWQELSCMLRLNKEVAREYIPGFPGGTLLLAKEAAEQTLAIVRSSSDRDSDFQADMRGQLTGIADHMSSMATAASLPESRGTEAEPLIAKSLDLVRDKLLEGRPKEAFELLDSLGNPDRFTDTYSQFRWHTNRAAALLLDGKKADAAREYLAAAAIDPKLQKAWSNRAHGHLLLNDANAALEATCEGLAAYPQSAPLWALHVAAKQLAGDAEPECGVPKHLLDTSDVRFSLSQVRHKQGRLEESLDLIRLCAEEEAPSLETRRCYLAAAISWAIEDPVAAYHDQLLPKQREALADALRRLEPLDATLAALQIDGVSEELCNNVCVALLLTRNLARAWAIASTGLARHPDLEGLLRIRVNELADKEDFVGLHHLTDGRYNELPTSTLATLAEISANKGDVAWHQSVMAILEKRERTAQQAADFRALTSHAHWEAGNKEMAFRLSNELLAEQPNHVLTHALLARRLMHTGKIEPASQHAELALQALHSNSPLSDVLYVADLLYDRNQYPEAAALYERAVISPAGNGLTQRYLACLIESGQRRKAHDVLNTLPPEARNTPVFRRIESNLARQMGDWPRMRDLLKQELDRMPTDSGVAVGYIGALHRIPGEKGVLKAYLASNPTFDGKQPFNEVEVAKYQREHGLPELAIKRLYRLFRSRPNDSAIGGYFLAQVQIGTAVPELAHAPTVVAAGVAAHLRSGSESRDIAIDLDEAFEGETWPELVRPASDLAGKLLGKVIGDKVTLSRGIGDVEYEIVGLSALYWFAAAKVHKLLAETANPAGPLWSVNLEKADGEFDFGPLLAMAQHKSALVADALKSYTQLRFPLATLAQLIGTQPLTLMLDWPYAKASLFVSIGTQEEREAALELLAVGGKRFVIDLPTLGELVGTGVFQRVIPLLGRPLVPQSAREELTNIIQYQETVPLSMSLWEEDGQYMRRDVTPEQLECRLALLREILACLDEFCEVTPVLGPEHVTDNHRMLERHLDNATLDAVYLALEHDAVLLSDDGGLRLVVPSVGLTNAIALQPLLMFARDSGGLDNSRYVDIVLSKVMRNHSFISVSAEDLLCLVRSDTTKVAAGIVSVFNTFRSRTLNLQIGVLVAAAFLSSVVRLCPPAITAEYFEIVLKALQQDRPADAEAVHHALAAAMEHEMQNLPKTLVKHLRREMGELLARPERQRRHTQLTPIARGVREFIMSMPQLGETHKPLSSSIQTQRPPSEVGVFSSE